MSDLPSVPELVAAYQELGSIAQVSRRYKASKKKIKVVLEAAGVLPKAETP